MYSPYDFKTTEEREGGKFKGTIVFTGIDEKLRGSWEDLGTYGGLAVCSCGDPEYTDSHVFLPGRYTEHDHSPITITDEPTFRRVVEALNAVRDKLIAEVEAKEIEAKDEVCWPDGQPLKTYNEEDDMESITVIDGVKKEKVYDFKATSFTENGKWVKGEIQFTWMNEKYRSKPGGKAIEIGSHGGRDVVSAAYISKFSGLFIPGDKRDDNRVLMYDEQSSFNRDVAALTACQYKPVVKDKPKMLDATLKAIDAYVVEREKEVKRINGVIEQLAGLKEKRPKDICDQFMKVKGKDQHDAVYNLPQQANTCPYCLEYYAGSCVGCEYAEAHGRCPCNTSGDWRMVRDAGLELQRAIAKAYPWVN